MQTFQAAPRPARTPLRTCVGCRTVRPQADLLRTRCPGGRVVATRAGAPGRSAYVCPSRACVESAVRKGGFKRSFRSNTVVETETLWTTLATDVTALELRNQKRSEEMHASGRNA